MKKIYCIGETVFDIIFKNSQPVTARPGGAMLNTSVSLGRLGLPVSFISEIGKDQTGDYIIGFLKENNVDVFYIDRFTDGKTAIAIAFLDEKENADYTFYKYYPEERLKQALTAPDESDIVLFGSFYSITLDVRAPLIKFLNSAKQNKAMILYDPNFRQPHLKELPQLIDLISENIRMASVVRGSDEDFELIYGCKNADQMFQKLLNNGCGFLIYTRGSKSVEFRSERFVFSLEVPAIRPVSSIGAGDSFNAGLIYYFFTRGIKSDGLILMNETQWKEAIMTAVSFGSHVCLHLDNYISWKFAKGCQNELR
jgi:fructokinase